MHSIPRYIIALCFMVAGAGLAVGQSNSPYPTGWLNLESGQTIEGIRFDQEGRLFAYGRVLTTCKPNEFNVLLSPPSSVQRQLLMCKSGTGDLDQAFIIDTLHSNAVRLNLGLSGIGIWVSWSPNDRFALIDLGAEDGPAHLFAVDLRTYAKREIRFSNFSRRNEEQTFSGESVAWSSGTAFSIDLIVYANDKLVRKYPARVNLLSAAVTYPAAGATASSQSTARPRENSESARPSSSNGAIRRVDFLNFTYPTSICAKEFGFGQNVRVRNGDFEEGSEEDKNYFGVAGHKVLFLETDSAIVQLACGHTGWNWGFDLFYLYKADDNGGATLIGTINSEEMTADYKRYFPGGTLVATTSVRTQNGALVAEWAADGARCCPDHIVTMLYRWDGRRFILSGRPQKRLFPKR